MINVFHQYSIREKNCELLIVGDGTFYKKIKDEISKIKYRRKIKLVGKTLNVEKYYNMSNIYISLSESEGFGNTFIEALACNLPIISKNNGGIRDVVKKSAQGKIVNNSNHFNLISCMQEINKKKNYYLIPSLNKYEKNFIFEKYLDFIRSCKI